jgi:hypothetical protein
MIWLLEIRSQRPGKEHGENRGLRLNEVQPSPVRLRQISSHGQAEPGAGIAAHRPLEDPPR